MFRITKDKTKLMLPAIPATPVEVKVPIYVNPKEVEDLVQKTLDAFKTFVSLEKECLRKNIQIQYLLKDEHKPNENWNRYSRMGPEYMVGKLDMWNLHIVSNFQKVFK